MSWRNARGGRSGKNPAPRAPAVNPDEHWEAMEDAERHARAGIASGNPFLTPHASQEPSPGAQGSRGRRGDRMEAYHTQEAIRRSVEAADGGNADAFIAGTMRPPSTGTRSNDGCAMTNHTPQYTQFPSFHSTLTHTGKRTPATPLAGCGRGGGGRPRSGGLGSRGGTNPPQRFVVGSNAARVSAYNAATAPSAVMGHVTDAEALDQLIAGAAQSDFTHQQHAPRGPAMAHSLLIQTLWNWNANGCKALVTQRESLLRTDVFPPNTWPVFEGKAGTYFEAQTIIGMLHLAKVRKEPGSVITNFSLLPWTKNDDLKYVYVCGGVHCEVLEVMNHIYTYNN